MCYFVIEITRTATGNAKPTFEQANTEEDVKTKIDALKADDSVERIRVFKASYTIRREMVWTQTAAPTRSLPPPEPVSAETVRPV